jgi:LmbE family N-acetylglucosaminyl deacetylase
MCDDRSHRVATVTLALMVNLKLEFNAKAPTFLFVGAHCDDIEIGCGGTALRLAREHARAKIYWVVLSSGEDRAREAQRAVNLMFGASVDTSVMVKDFRISYFPAQFAAIKDFFEELKASIRPDAVFTHSKDDLHQDHRTVAELVWNTFRDHLILEYEIPKYDGGLGSPSVFVPLAAADVQRKIDVLMEVYATQRSKQWFSPDTFKGLMRLRGIECNAPDGFAEAFYSRKVRLSI